MSTIELISVALLAVNTVGLLVLFVRGRNPAPISQPGTSANSVPLPQGSREKIEHNAEVAFEQAINAATAKMGADLAATSKQLNSLIVRITTEVVEKELEEYRNGLANARSEALQGLATMRQQMEQSQKGLEVDMNAELGERKKYLMEQIDHKLGETVSAYIVESLGQGADLGAQRRFMLESLERHKEDIKKDLTDGA